MELKWSDSLATGNPQMDEQHRSIFDAFEHLETAVREGRAMYTVYAITRLAHYVQNHLAAEENLMLQHGFPEIEQHIAEHAKFRAKIEELTKRSIDEDVSRELLDFVKDWLADHVGKADMAYVPYLKHGVVKDRA